MTRRICAVLSAACIAVLASGTASWAGEKPKPDTSHREVCHPKAGGWVVINPAQASSHIDEATGAPKHEHDGRVDQYAVNGACPTIPTTTPEPTWTPTPSTTSQTSPANPSTTSSVPSPSTTSHASTPKPSASTTRPATSQTKAPAPRSRTTSQRPVEPTPSSTSSSSVRPAAELAATGSSLDAAVVAAFLLMVGGLLIRASRRKGAH